MILLILDLSALACAAPLVRMVHRDPDDGAERVVLVTAAISETHVRVRTEDGDTFVARVADLREEDQAP